MENEKYGTKNSQWNFNVKILNIFSDYFNNLAVTEIS